MFQHIGSKKISFTGSTKAGITLASQSAHTMKRMSMELGGNAPFIVFDDANIANAVDGAMMSKYRNAGQTCVCANRFYVHRKIYDEFVEKFSAKVKTITMGHGFDPKTKQGPLISGSAIEKVEKHLSDAKQKGAKIVHGGKRGKVEKLENGHFFEPTVLANMHVDSLISKEEIFGPISAIYSFDNDDQVIHLANDTDFGLCSYMFTNNINRAFRVSERLEYGMVGVNSGHVSSEAAPFGGIKFSGVGREGSHYGIDEYLNLKYICFDNVN